MISNILKSPSIVLLKKNQILVFIRKILIKNKITSFVRHRCIVKMQNFILIIDYINIFIVKYAYQRN